MKPQVRTAVAGDEARWEAFVQASPEATFFHRFGWKRVLERAFGHRCHFLLAEENGEIAGVLPLAQVRSRLFGNKLAGLPFCVYGGIAGSPRAADALRHEACELARRLGVDALELRNQVPSGSDWPVKDLYYTFRKPVDPDNDVNMKAIPNKQRAMVRKGIKSGLQGEEVEGTGRLYRVYSESVRNLGTPVFSRRYLQLLRTEFGNDCRVLMILDSEGRDVAGVMSFYFRGEVLPYYGGSVARARDIKGCNDFMYWDLMRRSAEEGIMSFDFGRSKVDTGPFRFKKNWGFEPQPLPYEYFLVKADELPDVNPNNPKYRVFIDTWKRLPLPVANLIGPRLARSLG